MEAESAAKAATRKKVEGNGRPAGFGVELKNFGKGQLTVKRHFTRAGIHPFDLLAWSKRKASILGEKGEVIFEAEDLEFPEGWSQNAVNVVAQKYFRKKDGKRETSVKQVIKRVYETIGEWGKAQGYFATDEDVEIFKMELCHILVNQIGSFNSPVWFNVGIVDPPQCSACFINEVEDSMESILNLVYTEGMLFKYGSGTGTNFSPLRSKKETLTGGGRPSGPLSFIKVLDTNAGVIKSGGTTRRAAKMVILNVDHPDIMDFIKSKMEEEKKAWILINNGYDGSLDGEAYASVAYQNANHSVRVTDEFMKAYENDGEWSTTFRTTGEVADTYKASEIMHAIAEAAWACGDPGLQFDTTINKWHTCKNSGRINASNPCSEYMFLDNSACNLASINLMKFRREDGSFDIEGFKHTVDIFIIAQDIIVDNSAYPTKKIAENSHMFRPLGLGYANLGALLMSLGLPYDSDEGRAYASALTAIMTGEAYIQSAKLAQFGPGSYSEFEKNRASHLEVINMHRQEAYRIPPRAPMQLLEAARAIWDEAYKMGEQSGYANAQVTVLAPTGTIAFMMDCDTTGVEPDLSLVKVKKLVGGGTLEIVNNAVPLALSRLGYTDDEVAQIMDFVRQKGTIEGAPGIKEEHLPVFDCSFRPLNGSRSIHYMGHLKMLAAIQPFISGSISKTVNLPNEITVEEIERIYVDAWKLGLKCVALYRDGCKRVQPLSASSGESLKVEQPKPVRRRLPDERESITHKFEIGGHEGILTAGKYEDGRLGELFLMIHKEGSVVSGLANCLSIAVSVALQYGVPLETFVEKFAFQKFEPSGWTKNKQIRQAHSIVDYVFRYLALKFLPPAEAAKYVGKHVIEKEIRKEEEKTLTAVPKDATSGFEAADEVAKSPKESDKDFVQTQSDAPVCERCGSLMVRSGSCYLCLNCFHQTGSCGG